RANCFLRPAARTSGAPGVAGGGIAGASANGHSPSTPACQQRADPLSPHSAIVCGSVWQRGAANGQRGGKKQPLGSVPSFAGGPPIAGRRAPLAAGRSAGSEANRPLL